MWWRPGVGAGHGGLSCAAASRVLRPGMAGAPGTRDGGATEGQGPRVHGRRAVGTQQAQAPLTAPPRKAGSWRSEESGRAKDRLSPASTGRVRPEAQEGPPSPPAGQWPPPRPSLQAQEGLPSLPAGPQPPPPPPQPASSQQSRSCAPRAGSRSQTPRGAQSSQEGQRPFPLEAGGPSSRSLIRVSSGRMWAISHRTGAQPDGNPGPGLGRERRGQGRGWGVQEQTAAIVGERE